MNWDDIKKKIATPEEIAESKRMARSYAKVIHKPKGRERNAYKAMRKMLTGRVLREG
jgi:hypothetical protein